MKKLSGFLMSVLLSAAALFFTGCLNTKIPPYMSQDIFSDDKMIGQWVPVSPKTDEEPPIYTVIPKGDNLYQVNVMEKGEESVAQMTLFKLGGLSYLTLSYSDSDEHDTVQYSWQDNSLVIKGFDEKKFSELSKREKLDIDFTIDDSQALQGMVDFNTTTEKLRKFIEQYGAEVFAESPMILKRINE